MLEILAVENYRSLQQVVVPLRRLNVVTGPNGSGKSNLYRALRLIADSSRNGAVAALAREGGLESTLFAGPETLGRSVSNGDHPVEGTVRRKPINLRLGFSADDFGYAVDFGVPIPSKSAFDRDPEIKAESVWAGPVLRPATALSERRGGLVRVRRDDDWATVTTALRPFDSMLSEVADPHLAPELLTVREHIRSWRFYDHVRTDRDAPARSAQIGTRTPVLSHDGADLAAAVQTIVEIGDAGGLMQAVEEAFPRSSLEVQTSAGRMELLLHQEGLLRPLRTDELSDGTLRYLLWAAALLTPRPPTLMVLNEPETSLHPDLLPALAGLIVRASQSTQVVVVTHERTLVAALEDRTLDVEADVHRVELTKRLGRTAVVGTTALEDQVPWRWPER